MLLTTRDGGCLLRCPMDGLSAQQDNAVQQLMKGVELAEPGKRVEAGVAGLSPDTTMPSLPQKCPSYKGPAGATAPISVSGMVSM